MSSSERKEHSIDAPVLSFNLAERLAQLKSETQWSAEDRNAITLVKNSRLCIILMAFHKGAVMPKHQTNAPTTVLVVSGQIKMRFQGAEHTLREDELILMEPELPHDLEALEESAVLLTMNYPHAKAQTV